MAAGETNKAIAARLVLSERTVERHEQHPGEGGGLLAGCCHGLAYEHQLVWSRWKHPRRRAVNGWFCRVGAPRRRDSEPMSTKTIHSGARERLTEDLP